MSKMPTGDRGQRYQIEAVDYPTPGLNVIGWAVTPESAVLMAKGVKLAPSCAGAWVKDRQTGESTAI